MSYFISEVYIGFPGFIKRKLVSTVVSEKKRDQQNTNQKAKER